MIGLNLRAGWVLAMLLAGAGAAPVVAAPLEADLILRNADIYTPSGWAHAMAIKRGVIIEVGDEAAVAELLDRVDPKAALSLTTSNRRLSA